MTTTLSSYLNDYSNSTTQIAQELGKIGALELKLSGPPKTSVKLVRSYIDQCEVNTENERQVRSTYIEIIKVIEELKDHQKDLDSEF